MDCWFLFIISILLKAHFSEKTFTFLYSTFLNNFNKLTNNYTTVYTDIIY